VDGEHVKRPGRFVKFSERCAVYCRHRIVAVDRR